MHNLTIQEARGLGQTVNPNGSEPMGKIQARYAILAALPLPRDSPPDVLRPIVIPAPFTLHEFLGTAHVSLRAQLGSYRVFQQCITSWCPEREEHGYFLTPLFQCNTNPRVNTAHRWTPVDVTQKPNRQTECFYIKDEKWYYAGTYRAFLLDELTTQEWESLSPETTQALIKETLAGRKNTSPQNVYEIGQLYAAGALKIACVGLQCTGFSNSLYRILLEHAAKCAQTGKWRVTNTGPGSGPGGMWVGSPNPAVLSPNAANSDLDSTAGRGNETIEDASGGNDVQT